MSWVVPPHSGLQWAFVNITRYSLISGHIDIKSFKWTWLAGKLFKWEVMWARLHDMRWNNFGKAVPAYVGLAKLPQILYFCIFTTSTDVFLTENFLMFSCFLQPSGESWYQLYICIFIWLSRTNQNAGCSQLICEELHHRHAHMQRTNFRGKKRILFSSFQTFSFTHPGSRRWTFRVGNELVKTEYLSTEPYYCLTAALICPEVKHFSLLPQGMSRLLILTRNSMKFSPSPENK